MRDYNTYCFDIDGTLAPAYEPIGESVAKLLCSLLVAGKRIVFVTGRVFADGRRDSDNVLHAVIGKLPCAESLMHHIFVIPVSGALMLQYNDGWHDVFREQLTDEQVRMVAQVYGEALRAVLPESDQTFSFGHDVVVRENLAVACTGVAVSAPQEVRQAWDVDRSKRRALVAYMQGRLPGTSLYIGGGATVDVTREGVSKASALEKFFIHTGLKKEDAVFFGDGFGAGGNDEVVKEVGIDIIEVQGPEHVLSIFAHTL